MKRQLVPKGDTKKSGYVGDKIWRAHRLEGVVRNIGIKTKKKDKD